MTPVKANNFIISFLLMISFLGCSKETVIDPPLEEKDNGISSLLNYEINEAFLLVWQPKDYFAAQDVVIESADTAIISISKSFYERLENKVGFESILNITLADDELPFIRRVNSVDPDGERYYLETEMATMEDMFKNLKVEINTEPFFSPDNATRAGDMAAGFVDGDGVLHPQKYIISYPDGTKKVVDMTIAAQEWGMSFNWDLEDMYDHPLGSFAELKFEVNGSVNVHSHIGINISWFKLQSFEARVGGGIDIEVPLTLRVNSTPTISQMEENWDIVKGPSISAIAWVGSVPIAIGLVPKISIDLDLAARGSVVAKLGLDYNMDFEVGFRYDRNKGFSPIKKFSQNLNAWPLRIGAELDLATRIGVGPKLGIELYGSEIGYARIGPYIKGHAGVDFDFLMQRMHLCYNCAGGVGASIGADMKILSHKTFYWSQYVDVLDPYTILNYDEFLN